MKKFLLIVIALVIFQERHTIGYYLNPPPDYGADHQGKVILYATEWCGFCSKARQFLNEKGIPFYEYDIEKSSEGMAQYKSLGGGGIPVLLVNGQVVRGYRPEEILTHWR